MLDGLASRKFPVKELLPVASARSVGSSVEFKGEQIKDGLYQVSDMVEKPALEDAPSNLAIIGRYILTPDIFEIIERTPPGKNGELQITDALLEQAKNGCVMAYKFKGRRFDCGSVEGFVEATNFVFKNIYKA